jgi:Fe2+ or Zn2+ uptake regulation protein
MYEIPRSSQGLAGELIDRAGLHRTAIRVRTLAAMLESGAAMTHRHLTELLGGIDSVTLYRTLDWLARCGLVRKVVGADRVRRYSAGPSLGAGAAGGYVECVQCGLLADLDGFDHLKANLGLPAGFQAQQTEIRVRGVCARCAAAAAMMNNHSIDQEQRWKCTSDNCR